MELLSYVKTLEIEKIRNEFFKTVKGKERGTKSEVFHEEDLLPGMIVELEGGEVIAITDSEIENIKNIYADSLHFIFNHKLTISKVYLVLDSKLNYTFKYRDKRYSFKKDSSKETLLLIAEIYEPYELVRWV